MRCATASSARREKIGRMRRSWTNAHCDLKALADARARGCRTRVVLIADEPKSPPLGVDAVVTRPIRFAELVALIDSAPARAAVGPYHFEAGELRAPSGARLKLTEKETAILARLARAHGAAVSREALLRDVWGYGPNMSTRYARNAHSPSETQARAIARTAALAQNRTRRLPARRQRRGPRVLTLTPAAPPAHIEIAWGTPNKMT